MNQLSSLQPVENQCEFVNLTAAYRTEDGAVEKAGLYGLPRTDLPSHGDDALNKATELDELLRRLQALRNTDVAV